MNLRSLLVLTLSLASSHTWAFPLGKVGCNETAYERGFKSLVKKISIIDEDNRVALSVLAEKENWSEYRTDQIRRATGYVVCPGQDLRGASGSVVGTETTLFTAAHLIMDASGRPRKNCFFENQASPPDRIALSLKRGTYVVGTTGNPSADRKNDWAVVRLKRKPIGLDKAFAVDVSESMLNEGQQVFNFSANQRGILNQVNEFEPVAQKCSHRDRFHPNEDGNRTNVLMNDCDSSGGASGSVVVVDRGTDFVAVGVIVGGANSSHDKTPYNLLKGNATLSIAVDVPIIEVINRLSGVEVRTASAAQ